LQQFALGMARQFVEGRRHDYAVDENSVHFELAQRVDDLLRGSEDRMTMNGASRMAPVRVENSGDANAIGREAGDRARVEMRELAGTDDEHCLVTGRRFQR